MTAAGARPYGKRSSDQSVAFCRSVYDHVRKGSDCFDMNCYFVAAGEIVIRAGRTSNQKLYLKCGELILIVCEYQLLVRLDFD